MSQAIAKKKQTKKQKTQMKQTKNKNNQSIEVLKSDLSS